PRYQACHSIFQTYVTRSILPSPAHFESKLKECHRHWQAFASHYPNNSGFVAFELGTGWFPIIPIGFFLCGAKEVWTIDIDPLLSSAGMKRSMEFLCEYSE